MLIDNVTPYKEVDSRIDALERYYTYVNRLYEIAYDIDSEDLMLAVSDLEDRFEQELYHLQRERKEIEEGEAAYIELYKRRMKGDWS